MKSSIFKITNSKIWRISPLKVYLKLNQKVVLITLSTHDKTSLNMQKDLVKFSKDIQLQNFQGRNFSNFWVGNLGNRWLHKFILTLSDLWNCPLFLGQFFCIWKKKRKCMEKPGKSLLRTLESSRFLNSALFWCFVKKIFLVESWNIMLNFSTFSVGGYWGVDITFLKTGFAMFTYIWRYSRLTIDYPNKLKFCLWTHWKIC